MLNNTLFFKESEIRTISSYANRINDEVESGDIGYYHLIDTSLTLIDESLNFIQDKEHVKNVADAMGQIFSLHGIDNKVYILVADTKGATTI